MTFFFNTGNPVTNLKKITMITPSGQVVISFGYNGFF